MRKYTELSTKRFEFERIGSSWYLSSKVTGEIIVWSGMFKNMDGDGDFGNYMPFKEFMRNVIHTWRLWFFGKPYMFCSSPSDVAYWSGGQFKEIEELPF